jgi:hypothetical protein
MVQKIVLFDAATAAPLGDWSPRIQRGNIVKIPERGGSLVLTVNKPDALEILAVKFPAVESFKPVQPTTRESTPRKTGTAP